MKPMGRKHYKDNTGGKYRCKKNGKWIEWWDNICPPSKKRERQQIKLELSTYRHGGGIRD